ncbi:cation transporter [Owenweeksia hongkongensis]|uniref:cation transporter n=1 Tax=Owenweeksia hongkongensis TaxID=253245 RepID=UPI003A8F4424
MQKTIFKVSEMDCPSEEALIRMRLEGISGLEHLDFDIPNRELAAFHTEDKGPIEVALFSLNLGASHQSTEIVSDFKPQSDSKQSKLLWTVLIINFSFFVIEMLAGWYAQSMGLVADSMDMLADAFVYGLSLYAVGHTVVRKKKVARMAGYLQIVLAIIGWLEIVRRFLGEEEKLNVTVMIVVSVFALIANAICLYLLQKSKSKEAHMQASMIFTSNDIIINSGVILAAVLVYWLQSSVPDLVIGTLVLGIVMRGAIRMLKLGK